MLGMNIINKAVYLHLSLTDSFLELFFWRNKYINIKKPRHEVDQKSRHKQCAK